MRVDRDTIYFLILVAAPLMTAILIFMFIIWYATYYA